MPIAGLGPDSHHIQASPDSAGTEKVNWPSTATWNCVQAVDGREAEKVRQPWDGRRPGHVGVKNLVEAEPCPSAVPDLNGAICSFDVSNATGVSLTGTKYAWRYACGGGGAG